nr:RNA-directed DNA polymerase, eukaryota [Tanacetum cinerariifolium]
MLTTLLVVSAYVSKPSTRGSIWILCSFEGEKNGAGHTPSPSLSHPPGFTLAVLENNNKKTTDNGDTDSNEVHATSAGINTNVVNSPGDASVVSFSEQGCNSSFVALIPKVIDAKFVNDFRPISLIGCVYKVVTKILAKRLISVIEDLISDTQSAFVTWRQILDGPFILDEVLHWCKRRKKRAMFFKVDFAKADDSVRWDYLLDILEAFGFGQTWCKWVRGIINSAKASILVNGSPTKEFSCHCGLKQEDPLAPYLFILIMESLHISFNRAVDEGLFKGIQLPGLLSLFLIFLHGRRHVSRGMVSIVGVGVPRSDVEQAVSLIGCSILNNQFRYLGVTVGQQSSRLSAWDDIIAKLRSRLSKWNVKTLSIGGHLTLLKSVLRASPSYNMSIFKVPRGALKIMEVADKLNAFVEGSFRRKARGGIEQHQLSALVYMLEPISLSNSNDRWVCDLSGDGNFK